MVKSRLEFTLNTFRCNGWLFTLLLDINANTFKSILSSLHRLMIQTVVDRDWNFNLHIYYSYKTKDKFRTIEASLRLRNLVIKISELIVYLL